MNMKYIIIFFIAAILTGCGKEVLELNQPQLQNPPVDPNDVLISFLGDSIPADGKSFGEVSLKVSSTVLAKYKEANFQVFPIGKFNNDSTTTKLTLDINGEARIFVKSDIAGLAYVKTTINNLSKTTVVKFYKSNFDTLQLSLVNNIVPADNYSYAEIRAVTKGLNPNNRSITFVTDKGLFSNNSNTYTLQTGANDTTRAYVRYSKTDLVKITATVAGTYSRELYINFAPAYPTQLQVDMDSVFLTRTFTAKTKVTVRLLRSFGTASEGQIVHYYDSVAAPGPLRSIGNFFNATISNAAGSSTAEYRLMDITYSGFVYIKSYVETPAGRVYGQNVLLIQ